MTTDDEIRTEIDTVAGAVDRLRDIANRLASEPSAPPPTEVSPLRILLATKEVAVVRYQGAQAEIRNPRRT